VNYDKRNLRSEAADEVKKEANYIKEQLNKVNNIPRMSILIYDLSYRHRYMIVSH